MKAVRKEVLSQIPWRWAAVVLSSSLVVGLLFCRFGLFVCLGCLFLVGLFDLVLTDDRGKKYCNSFIFPFICTSILQLIRWCHAVFLVCLKKDY